MRAEQFSTLQPQIYRLSNWLCKWPPSFLAQIISLLIVRYSNWRLMILVLKGSLRLLEFFGNTFTYLYIRLVHGTQCVWLSVEWSKSTAVILVYPHNNIRGGGPSWKKSGLKEYISAISKNVFMEAPSQWYFKSVKHRA